MIGVSFTTNTSRLKRALSQVKAGAPAIRDRATIKAAGIFVQTVHATSPKDTHRYVRGWVLAGNDAGVTTMPVPAVQESQWAHVHVERLRRQVADWKRIVKARETNVDFWDGARRKSKVGLRGKQRTAANKCAKALEKAEETLLRAEKELERWESASMRGNAPIVIYGNTTGRGGAAAGPRRRIGISVRSKLYGGKGAVTSKLGVTIVVLRNLEAHASIVEKRCRSVQASLQLARAKGMVIARREYAATLHKLMDKAG